VRTTRFWNTLYHARSKPKDWKVKFVHTILWTVSFLFISLISYMKYIVDTVYFYCIFFSFLTLTMHKQLRHPVWDQVIFSTDESAMYIVSKQSKHQNMLYDFSICFTLLCKMNERIYDMTPNRMMLDVSVSAKKKIQQTFNLITVLLSVLLRFTDYDYPFGILALLNPKILENRTSAHFCKRSLLSACFPCIKYIYTRQFVLVKTTGIHNSKRLKPNDLGTPMLAVI
jgi:hypothetical protein